MNDEVQRKKLVAEVFDRAAPTYDSLAGSYFTWFGTQLADRIDISEGTTVLDVACGKGAALFPAARRCGATGTAVGVDLSFEMASATRDRSASLELANVRIAVMDADALAVADERVDALLCAFSLHFFSDPGHTLSGFARVVKPGGVVAISEWGEGDERWGWESELIGRLAVRGVTTAPVGSADELASLLSNSGLSDVRADAEALDVTLADADEWWEWKWSYSFRYVLEQLDADAREGFKRDAYERIASIYSDEPITLTLHANIATGRKPG